MQEYTRVWMLLIHFCSLVKVHKLMFGLFLLLEIIFKDDVY